MKASEILIDSVNKYYQGNEERFIKLVEDNIDLIDKEKFSVLDIKFKDEKLIAPTGQSTLIHRWHGQFYFNLAGDDWDNFAEYSYKHVTTINELKPFFIEVLNGGGNLGHKNIMNVAKYFNNESKQSNLKLL